MSIKISSTKDAKAHGLKICVYGPAGAGKTRLCATTPDPDKTLIVSAEAGLLSLREHDIAVTVIESIDDLRAVHEFLTGSHPYTWVIIDSLSEIAEQCLAHEKTQTTNGMRAYGEMGDVMFKLIRAFRDLPGINVVMTAKQGHVQDEEGRVMFGPLLPGKQLSQGLAYLFDEVFVMRAERDPDGKVRRSLQTVSDGKYEAKDRSGALEQFEPPSLKRIAAKIMAAPKPKEPATVPEATTTPTKG